MTPTQTFRANVGIVVLNDKWKVLALERIDKEALKRGEKKGAGQWQMPQGGLDEGEEPTDAWMRELREEIHVGAKDVEHLGCYPEWLTYELPKEVRERPEVKEKQGRGQVQLWSFVPLKQTAEIRLEPDSSTLEQEQEFVAYKWTTLGALAEETWEVRRSIYLKLALPGRPEEKEPSAGRVLMRRTYGEMPQLTAQCPHSLCGGEQLKVEIQSVANFILHILDKEVDRQRANKLTQCQSIDLTRHLVVIYFFSRRKTKKPQAFVHLHASI